MIQPGDPTIRRIAVLRANGLGDFLFATPALRALGAAFPDAEITYLCLPWLQSFIAGRYPYIQKTLVVPPYPGIRAGSGQLDQLRSEANEFFTDCQTYAFDLAIQMHGGGVESNPFVRRLGARFTVGLSGRGIPPLDYSLTYQFYQHEVLRYLELVGEIGVSVDNLQMDAPEVAGDEERLRHAWPELDAGDYVVVHPGASDPRRRWPIERFAAVADYVQQTYHRTVVISGSLADRRLAQQLRAGTSRPVVDLSGQIDLGALVALIRRAGLVVSNDTGVAHIAYAVEAPSVVIYWCGNLITAGPFRRARFRPVLSWTLDCPACGARRCKCPVSFVAEAPLGEVIDHVDDLLVARELPAPSPDRSATSLLE
ncbi:MAG TPA: glycosyltransferase family 9 protein [Chloroflexota bacterium]|nr:glycosyltransferase family 9 protein [Chloroflexota bacterium]